MKQISILNDVLGPVMRGPSSSHTAGSYHLAALAQSLLGEAPAEAVFTFDRDGSYGRCLERQGSDLAFTAALLGCPITDPRFPNALELAPKLGLDVRFESGGLPEADHPNHVRIRLKGTGGAELSLSGKSIGGGAVEVTSLEGWPVLLRGDAHEVLVETDAQAVDAVAALLSSDGQSLGELDRRARRERSLLRARRASKLPEHLQARLQTHEGVRRLWQAQPLTYVKRGRATLASAAELVALAEAQGTTAGRLGAAYEAELLGLTEAQVVEEMLGRFAVMADAVHTGLGPDLPSMQLLRPSAGGVYEADSQGRLPIGGLHTRVAARAMAAVHVNCGMGVVCAAPTAGSAGVLPGVLVSLQEERGLDEETIVRCLFAAGIMGAIVAERATFAAEVAGCQVEIGAAGAMAAAAVVEAADGTARQAADAAAVSFQNTMGSVCDLVQGVVEIPCHTRNAVAASSAMVVADLILGGYENPIPLDETIDAVYAVGKMMPPELRVTSLGGLAVAPSARAMRRLR
jgi:L-serine dehydratase